MKRLLGPLLFLILLAAACGDATVDVDAGSGSDDAAGIPAEPDDGIGDGAEPLPDVSLPVADEQVITDTKPVDGKVTTPSEVVVNPENDSELWVRFIGGDPNCTAGYVTVLTETPDLVQVELTVGITDDALVKSCLAGEFDLRIDVALNESAVGKQIDWVSADSAEPAMQLTPDLSTDDFVGLTEAAASELAEENGLVWRVARIDGENFALTEDFNPSRVNFEIDNGTVSSVSVW